MGKLEGKVAVITGGGTGMGRATAQVFVIVGRRQNKLDVAVREIGRNSPDQPRERAIGKGCPLKTATKASSRGRACLCRVER